VHSLPRDDDDDDEICKARHKVIRRATISQPNKCAFTCQANVEGERVADHREAGKLFQMTGPATMKLFIPSLVLVLGTDSDPVPTDRQCRLPAMVKFAEQSSSKRVGAKPCRDL